MSHSPLSKVNWLQISITTGIVMLLFGLQLRAIESFVCTPSATGLLADWFGPSQDTAQGALQRMMAEKTEYRHVFQPPAWVGWAMLSSGFVLLVNGIWGMFR